jgi:hypothetical protein
MNFRSNLIFILLFLFSLNIIAQRADSIPEKKKWHKNKIIRSLVVPAALIGYSLSTMQDKGVYSSIDAQRDIQKRFSSFDSNADDYMIYVPYAELAALNLFKVKNKSNFVNLGILIAKSELLSAVMVYPLKKWSHVERPNGDNFYSFPSGHTTSAFVAASIIHQEYKHKSPWISVAAYSVASSVGVLRMLNNAHWKSDVLAGAGFGILAVNLTYMTHRYRWGRDIRITPFTTKRNGVGLTFTYQIK